MKMIVSSGQPNCVSIQQKTYAESISNIIHVYVNAKTIVQYNTYL